MQAYPLALTETLLLASSRSRFPRLGLSVLPIARLRLACSLNQSDMPYAYVYRCHQRSSEPHSKIDQNVRLTDHARYLTI